MKKQESPGFSRGEQVNRIFRTRAEAREALVDDWPEHGCIGQLGFDGWDYEEER